MLDFHCDTAALEVTPFIVLQGYLLGYKEAACEDSCWWESWLRYATSKLSLDAKLANYVILHCLNIRLVAIAWLVYQV